jgi:hypothetical protein
MFAAGLETTVAQVQLFVIEPDPVGQHRALAEQAEVVEVGGRPAAVFAEAVVDLRLRLREVDLDRRSRLGRELGEEGERLFADHVDRVRGERRGDRAAEPGQQLEALARLGLRALRVAALVEHRRADRRPHPGVGDCTRGRLRLPVHVPEAGGAGADHLQAGEPRAPVDVVGLELRLDRPDPLFQPGHQRQVAAGAAEEGHRGVGVAVDQRRDEDRAGRVECLLARLGDDVGAERGDCPVGGAAQADALPVESSRVDDKERAHCGPPMPRARPLSLRPRPFAVAPLTGPPRRAGGGRRRARRAAGSR